MSIALENTVHKLIARMTEIEARVAYLERQKLDNNDKINKSDTLKLKPR